ncbi:NAD-dependent epimerase/dehydratase family protein [Prochlorococcus sp. MIT 1223]|uniref:NAD-dependent epimerase/dehydratase family protein n=1 Tax=Prochlorococcus sp. MIT 1223 TaxID=3096217 RepID=UPI002A74CFE8|nr:NAD-dependent epimerase/dehydratase family protein [Prochlorococcus sp. MIT 1223]
MKILIIGGTRFIGKSLVRKLASKGYEITLFTRGLNPVPDFVEHIKGDRHVQDDLQSLAGRNFDVITDSSGRTLEDSKRIIEITGHPNLRFIYISSAGVYQKSEVLPLNEECLIDENSRHIGKYLTEIWLKEEKIPYTSFRPTYIYGPGNYNPIEKWFFDRLLNKRPIPIPDNGHTITQLGHVEDLTSAIAKSLESDKTLNQIYNCSSKQAVTFKGLVYIAAKACGVIKSDINLTSFNSSMLDSKSRKAFPLRLEHFYTDISKLEKDIDWTPEYDINQGFIDSYNNDYLLNRNNEIDFTSDEKLIDS